MLIASSGVIYTGCPLQQGDIILICSCICSPPPAQVDVRSTTLARQLMALGVGREVVVGVMLDRSFELIVSILAVLKAGGAYLPLDPGYPPERLVRCREIY